MKTRIKRVKRSRYEQLFRVSLGLFIISLILLIVCTLIRWHVENELKQVKNEISELYGAEIVAYKSVDVTCNSVELIEVIEICSANTFKSWMDYQSITDRSSDQWDLQQEAVTDKNYGFRMIDGYILVAMGSEYGPVGTKYLIEFDDGKVINAMIGDIKHEGCTSKPDGSMIEFIIDTEVLPKSIMKSGNFNDLFKGSIKVIRLADN